MVVSAVVLPLAKYKENEGWVHQLDIAKHNDPPLDTYNKQKIQMQRLVFFAELRRQLNSTLCLWQYYRW